MFRAMMAAVAAFAVASCAPRGSQLTFENAEVTLSATLLLPDSAEKVPAVVLIHGSGEADRNSMRHFAEIFVRNGVAALIYDKRGVGRSTGSPDAWQHFDFDDLAGDAAAGMRVLAEREEIDPERIGVFGASQGGWVAPLAAVKFGRSAFLVLFSPSVTTVARDRLFERAARLRTEGFTEDEIAEASAMQELDQEFTRSGEGFEDFRASWEEHQDKRWFRRVYLGDAPLAAEAPWRQWYRSVLDFDPVPILERLDAPALFLFGDPELDRFGPVAESIAAVETLRQSGKRYEVESYVGADHNLQLVACGGDAPYAQRIGEWLRREIAGAARP